MAGIGSPRTRPVHMIFGRSRPPLVPDPGQQVELLTENGECLRGFRAASGPLTSDRDGVAVWVATEEEYLDAKREGRPPVCMPWPAQRVTVRVPWWRWQRWFTRRA
jgi:hypothetical protein